MSLIRQTNFKPSDEFNARLKFDYTFINSVYLPH